jgi:2-aminoadipate transaminase
MRRWSHLATTQRIDKFQLALCASGWQSATKEFQIAGGSQMFEFAQLLSTVAKGQAKPFSGLPEFHFVGGNIDEATVPANALAEAVGNVIRNQGHAMGKYGMNSGPQGYLPLRETISEILKRRAGMSVDPGEILVTTGSLQAMDLVNKALLNKGDVVLVEASN